jgi:cell wall-associated NlpC family hydrolase
VPADATGAVPAPADVAPPIGDPLPPAVDTQPLDPVASAAAAALTALSSWRDLEASRAGGPATDDAPDTGAAAAASAYRAARDALAGAVVARAGRPPADGVALSAAWETTDPRRVQVVLAALMQVGKRYVFATAGPDTFDCSGLTLYAWRTVGVGLVHYAITQRQQTLDAAGALQPGDLVFRFRRPGGHVMLYLGIGDLVVQAGGTSTGVTVGAWGRTDAFGAPLARPVPAAIPPPPLFGAAAGTSTIPGDEPYAADFNAAGRRYNVAPALLAAVAAAGTGFRADAATAPLGGLMRLRPGIAAEMAVDPADATQAINGAARRLADLWSELHDETAVVTAYPTALHVVRSTDLIPHDDASDAFVAAVFTNARATLVRGAPPPAPPPPDHRLVSRTVLAV